METITPWFPCWGIEIEEGEISISKFVEKFLEIRPNNRWLLISKYAAASEMHLWSTWYSMEQQYFQNTALSNNPDAEFIRILAGTQQLKTAFSRAGLIENDKQAWLIYLPKPEPNLEELPLISTIEFTESAQQLIYLLNATIINERPKPTIRGLERLGIKYNGKNNSINDELFISHTSRSYFSS
jgi:tRNA threonylcarbamoyladenosine modification (KEOPS) complex Cgi121 subunit